MYGTQEPKLQVKMQYRTLNACSPWVSELGRPLW